MRRYMDLTEQEVLDLTGEEINHYIDIECAVEGKPLLPPLPEPPGKPPAGPDEIWYVIQGLSGSILFPSSKALSCVIEAIMECGAQHKVYLPNGDYSAFRVEPLSHLVIEPIPVFSEEAWAERAKDSASYQERQKLYERLKANYDEVVEAREPIVNNVVDYFNTIIAHHAKKNEIRETFKRYLELADNDAEIAMNFMEKTIEIQDDIKDELLKEAA